MTTNAAREPRGLSHARTSFVGRSDAADKVAGLPTPESPAQAEAVTLFVERARQIDPDGPVPGGRGGRTAA